MKFSARASIAVLIASAAFAAAPAPKPTASPEVAAQIAQLSDRNTADVAAMKLQAMGAAAIPALIAALESPDSLTQGSAAGLLGRMGDPSALPALRKIALSKEPLAPLAQQSIGQIGGPAAAACLIEVLNLPVSGEAARSIAQDLGAIGDIRAVEPLVQLLQGKLLAPRKPAEDYSRREKLLVRAAAAEALGHFRDPRAGAALTTAIADDPDWDVYRAARKSLRVLDEKHFPKETEPMVILAVEKRPEPPEGADAVIKKWHDDIAKMRSEPGSGPAWGGPSTTDYASATDIYRARKWVVGLRNDEIIELLMQYLRNLKISSDTVEQAKKLLVQIGPPAVADLEIGAKRGDEQLKINCKECLDRISKSFAEESNK